jgi:hypothetical protein
MTKKLTTFLRGHGIAIVALFLALSGGYAIAATTSSTKTLTACANKKTGELYLHHRGRCKRGQTKISWNERGPAGAAGAAGAPGAPAVSVSAIVSQNGTAAPAQGLTVEHTATGTYQVTITASQCANKQSAPVVSVSQSYPLSAPPQPAGVFPTAWVGDSGPSLFTVYTGDVVNGVYTPTDQTFNIQDVCS